MNWYYDINKTYKYKEEVCKIIAYCKLNNICLLKTEKGKVLQLKLPVSLIETTYKYIPIVKIPIGEEIKIIKEQLDNYYFKMLSKQSVNRIAHFIYIQKLITLNKI